MVKLYLKEEERKDEKKLRVFLEDNGSEGISLMVDSSEKGNYFVATIELNGKLKLSLNISKDIGLDVDEEGRIKIEK